MPIVTTVDDGRSVLLDVINSIEKTNLTLVDVTFSTPEINLTTDPLRNTRLKIKFNPSSGKIGNMVVNYNRIHKSELPILTVDRVSETSHYELLPVINSVYNLTLTENDINDQPLVDLDPIVTIDLEISDNSLKFYQGSIINTVGVIEPYSVTPANLTLGYVCNNGNKFEEFTDGYGSTYLVLKELNSPDCIV